MHLHNIGQQQGTRQPSTLVTNQATVLVLDGRASQHRRMIITHTVNAEGQRRVYIGGKGSLDCWIEPHAGSHGWAFHLESSVTGNALTPAEKHHWAVHTLLALATELNVAPQDLAAVPFETIAALHTADPFAGRRMPTSRRKVPDNAFFATAPTASKSTAEFSRKSFDQYRRQR